MRCDRKSSAMIFADAQKLEKAAFFAWNIRSAEKRCDAPTRNYDDLLSASTTSLRFLLAAAWRLASRMTPGFRAFASAAR
jgi:hypothetical protein